MYICTITFRCGMYRVPGIIYILPYTGTMCTNDAREHQNNNVAFVTLQRSSSMRAVSISLSYAFYRPCVVCLLSLFNKTQQQERAQ